MTQLNLGCGEIRPQNWINTDSSLNSRFQKIPFIGKLIPRLFKSRKYDSLNVSYMNLNKKWRFKNETVDVVYSSHVFEHLSIKSSFLYLKEAYRVLKPNGVLRIVIPDLYGISKLYVTAYEKGDETATSDFLWCLNLHKEGQYPNESILTQIIHLIEGYPHQHKFMYDEKSIEKLLNQYHFRNISFLKFAQSNSIETITDVEYREWGIPSIYIEALK